MKNKTHNIKIFKERRRHDDIEYHVNLYKKQITCIIFTKNYIKKLDDIFNKQILSRFNPNHLHISLNTDKLYNAIDVKNYIKPQGVKTKGKTVYDCRNTKKMHLQPVVKYDNIYTYRYTMNYTEDITDAQEVFLTYKEEIYTKTRQKEHSLLLQYCHEIIKELTLATENAINVKDSLKQKFKE